MALGRGLGALISSTGKVEPRQAAPAAAARPDQIWHIPVSKIQPNKNQPRRNFAPEELDELASSIREHGILQPLLLAEKEDGNYEIIAGERRWRAAKLLGLPTVPTLIKQFTEQKKLEVALIENIQRENLNPIEEAFAYQRLITEFNLTQQEVADKVGRARPTVANILRLLDLPERAQQALVDKKISTGQGKALLALSGEAAQLDMLSSMLGQKITVRELEEKVHRKGMKNPTRRDPNIIYLEDKIRANLGTKVFITKKGERGNISVAFYSDEEFKRLVKKLAED